MDCSDHSACTCFKNKCQSSRENNCENDSDCQKTIKSCTKKNPCICVSDTLEISPNYDDWFFTKSGVCVRKSDGCLPGRKPKTCRELGHPEWSDEENAKRMCRHIPFKPHERRCPDGGPWDEVYPDD